MNTQNNVEKKELFPINTRVRHFDGGPSTHGIGTIVAYNGVQSIPYVKSNFKEAVEMAGKAGLVGAIVNSFYDSNTCPYIVQWDNGYKDVYEHTSVTLHDPFRENFEYFVRRYGLPDDNIKGVYTDPETARHWTLWQLAIKMIEMKICAPHRTLSKMNLSLFNGTIEVSLADLKEYMEKHPDRAEHWELSDRKDGDVGCAVDIMNYQMTKFGMGVHFQLNLSMTTSYAKYVDNAVHAQYPVAM